MKVIDTPAAVRRPLHGGFPDPPEAGQNASCPEQEPLAATRDRIMWDPRFQSACQRYAHGSGSSAAIASAALAALVGDAPMESDAR